MTRPLFSAAPEPRCAGPRRSTWAFDGLIDPPNAAADSIQGGSLSSTASQGSIRGFWGGAMQPLQGPNVITAVGPRARFKAPCLGTRHHRGPGHERDSTGAACARADTAVPAMSATQRSAMPTALTAVPAMSAIPGVRLGLRRHRVRAVRWPPSLGRTSPGSMSPGDWGPHTSSLRRAPRVPAPRPHIPPRASLSGFQRPPAALRAMVLLSPPDADFRHRRTGGSSGR